MPYVIIWVRNSISQRNRQRAEDLRRTGLRNANVLPKINIRPRPRARVSDGAMIYDGGMPKMNPSDGPRDDVCFEKRDEMMEFYLEEQAEMTASAIRLRDARARKTKSKGRETGRESKQGTTREKMKSSSTSMSMEKRGSVAKKDEDKAREKEKEGKQGKRESDGMLGKNDKRYWLYVYPVI